MIGLNFFVCLEYLTDTNNTFDHLCINYSNERLQKIFVDRMLSEEKQWYEDQELDIPFVQFFDNSQIIGMKSDSFLS